jgi:hypothetical protein
MSTKPECEGGDPKKTRKNDEHKHTHTHTQRKRKIEQKCKVKQENRKNKRGIRQNFQRLNFSGQSAISKAHHLGLKNLLK